MRLRLSILALGLALAASACKKKGPVENGACTADTQCIASQKCSHGVCIDGVRLTPEQIRAAQLQHAGNPAPRPLPSRRPLMKPAPLTPDGKIQLPSGEKIDRSQVGPAVPARAKSTPHNEKYFQPDA